jgi:hypothetical protein
MFGGHINRLFAVKCMLTDYPFEVIGFFMLSSSVLLAYMIRIVEFGHKINLDQTTAELTEFKYLQDALWYVFVTYGTIGYGDYFPKTNLGRLFGVTAGLTGTYMISVLVISLQNRLSLNNTEVNVII